jgi:aspartokinase/homoserine dehydrogenase 1
VLLDCTASELLPQHYCSWLGQQGLHIITPNKKLGAGPLQRYQQLRQITRETGKHFMYEVKATRGYAVGEDGSAQYQRKGSAFAMHSNSYV